MMNTRNRKKYCIFFIIVFFIFFLYSSTKCSFIAPIHVETEDSDSSTLHQEQLHNSLDYISSEAIPNNFIRNNLAARVVKESKAEVKLACLINLFAIAFAIVLFPILIYGTSHYLVKGGVVSLWRITLFIHKSDGKKKYSYATVMNN